MGVVAWKFHTRNMAPLKLVNRLGAHKTERNLGCINTILQMLKSVPEIEKMFQSKSYSVGCNKDMPICDEISELFRAGKNEGRSAAYLRMLIRKNTAEVFPCFGEDQDLFVFFRIIHQAVRKELRNSNKKSVKSWNKFRRSNSLSCQHCGGEEMSEDPDVMSLSPVEGSNTFISRLINSFNLQEEGNDKVLCRLCDDTITKNDITKLPDHLLVMVTRTKATGDSVIFPENQMKLLNGESYTLRSIVDEDDGQYTCAVISNNTWVICDGTEITPASKDDVKTRNNILLLYEKIQGAKEEYQCPMPGCPLDKTLQSENALRRHVKLEHPKCQVCGKTFLINCLYREHMQTSKECQPKVAIVIPKHKIKSKIRRDSGIDSMSDSNEENNLKVVEKENISEQVIMGRRKRKAKNHEDNFKNKVQKLTNNKKNLCMNQTKPIMDVGDTVATSGDLFRENSMVNGISTFIPFDNSFLKTLGLNFHFKNSGGVIKILSSTEQLGEWEYKLVLSSEKNPKRSKIRGTIGERRSVAAYDLDSFCVPTSCKEIILKL